jgi:hypothetical protein
MLLVCAWGLVWGEAAAVILDGDINLIAIGPAGDTDFVRAGMLAHVDQGFLDDP